MPRRQLIFPSRQVTGSHLPIHTVLERMAYAIGDGADFLNGADVDWELAELEFQRTMAYYDWLNSGEPHGLHEQHMKQAGTRMRIAKRADQIFWENDLSDDWLERAWDQATAELLYV